MALEKKRGKEEAGLINRYKVFAKMQTAEDFEVLVDGLICELTRPLLCWAMFADLSMTHTHR